MATHDYNIANDTGANVRSDINDALSAIVTHNSNATAPGTTFAYMHWMDTSLTIDTVKIRNAADSAWATLYTDTGLWRGADGTAAAPALSFGSDVDTGFYLSGANQISLSSAGTERVRFALSSTNFLGAHAITVGVADTSQSTVILCGGSGAAAGGILQIQNSGGDDTTYDYFQFKPASGGAWLDIGPDTDPNVAGIGATGIRTTIAGSAAAPCVHLNSDSDTGLYSPGANQFGLATNGTAALTFDASQNATFTAGVTMSGGTLSVTGNVTMTTQLNVNTSNANADTQIRGTTDNNVFRVDASGNNIGMGTGAPNASSKLDISSTTGALLVPRMTTTQRNALTATNGMIIYNTTDNQMQGYINSAWAAM